MINAITILFINISPTILLIEVEKQALAIQNNVFIGNPTFLKGFTCQDYLDCNRREILKPKSWRSHKFEAINAGEDSDQLLKTALL